jgi:hypothetical protein
LGRVLHGTFHGHPGGLWSLVVKASDSATLANTGTATRAINIQNNPPAGFPLYYFEIIAAIIAGLMLAAFVVFKRRRMTSTRLKIDLTLFTQRLGELRVPTSSDRLRTK